MWKKSSLNLICILLLTLVLASCSNLVHLTDNDNNSTSNQNNNTQNNNNQPNEDPVLSSNANLSSVEEWFPSNCEDPLEESTVLWVNANYGSDILGGSYSALPPYGCTAISGIAPEDPLATLVVLSSAKPSSLDPTKVNSIVIEVTAQDGVTSKIYYIDVPKRFSMLQCLANNTGGVLSLNSNRDSVRLRANGSIVLSGGNTSSAETYLFFTGPGLPSLIEQINSPDPVASKIVAVVANSWSLTIANVLSSFGAPSFPGKYIVYAFDKDPKENPETVFCAQLQFVYEVGPLTIIAAGDQSYPLGETEVRLSGENASSTKTYLFVTGPDLPAGGARLSDLSPVVNGNAATFTSAEVMGDNSWSYKWGKGALDLATGQYTIYAVSQPVDKDHLQSGNIKIWDQSDRWINGETYLTHASVSIELRLGIISFSVSRTDGNLFSVNGTNELSGTTYFFVTCEGLSAKGAQINAPLSPIVTGDAGTFQSTAVNGDYSFSYTLDQTELEKVTDLTTCTIYAVNQPVDLDNYVEEAIWYNGGYLNGAKVEGALSIFVPVVPYLIIDVPIGDRFVGDTFIVSASTNLAVDDEVSVKVYLSSQPETILQEGIVKVVKGDDANIVSFDVDTTTFEPGEYTVTMDGVIQVVSDQALFNVIAP